MKSWRREASEQTSALMRDARNDPPFPDDVREWLAGLELLNDVPLSYLVPDEKALPPESIRFFIVDPQWTAALADGATSIGVETKLESERNAAHGVANRLEVRRRLPLPRYRRMHANHRRRREADVLGDFTGECGGFILRSALVAHWKGMEVKGYSPESAPLDILRMDTFSNRILLCLFNGYAAKVEFHEPREALHFGTRDASRTIELRSLEPGREGEPVYENGSGKPASITVPAEANGRVRVAELAAALGSRLNAAKHVGGFASPHLMLEMLSVAGQAEFDGGLPNA